MQRPTEHEEYLTMKQALARVGAVFNASERSLRRFGVHKELKKGAIYLDARVSAGRYRLNGQRIPSSHVATVIEKMVRLGKGE